MHFGTFYTFFVIFSSNIQGIISYICTSFCGKKLKTLVMNDKTTNYSKYEKTLLLISVGSFATVCWRLHSTACQRS